MGRNGINGTGRHSGEIIEEEEEEEDDFDVDGHFNEEEDIEEVDTFSPVNAGLGEKVVEVVYEGDEGGTAAEVGH